MPAPATAVEGVSSEIVGAAIAMVRVAEPPPVKTVKVPVPADVLDTGTTMDVAEADVGVTAAADPPGGVNVIEVNGDRLVPVSVIEAVVFTAMRDGLAVVSVGVGAVIAKFAEFDDAVPVVTKICAVPATVSSVFGTDTVINVVDEALPERGVVGEPAGGIQVAVVLPIANPLPTMFTLVVALF